MSATTFGEIDPPAQVERGRIQLDGSGSATWTYETPFPAGIVPRVSVAVEGGTSPVLAQINTTPTNTSVTIRAWNLPTISVVGILVIGAPTVAASKWVNLIAVSP